MGRSCFGQEIEPGPFPENHHGADHFGGSPDIPEIIGFLSVKILGVKNNIYNPW